MEQLAGQPSGHTGWFNLQEAFKDNFLSAHFE